MKPAGAPGPPSACRTLGPSLTEPGHAAQCRGRAAAPACTRGRRGVHSLPRPPRPPAPAAVLPLASGGAGGRMARRPSRPGTADLAVCWARALGMARLALLDAEE